MQQNVRSAVLGVSALVGLVVAFGSALGCGPSAEEVAATQAAARAEAAQALDDELRLAVEARAAAEAARVADVARVLVAPVEAWRAVPTSDRAAELATWLAIPDDAQLHAPAHCSRPIGGRCSLVTERTERMAAEQRRFEAAILTTIASLSPSERAACERDRAQVPAAARAAGAAGGAETRAAVALRALIARAKIDCHEEEFLPIQW